MKQGSKSSSKKTISNSPGNFWNNKKLQVAVISILTFFIYARTISYEYIDVDDQMLIAQNYNFIKKVSNIPQAFNQDVFRIEKAFGDNKCYYRPIFIVSLMLDAQISGSPKPKFYHFSNLLYHIIACLLLFVLFHRLKVNSISAFMLTLLFALHPMLTQAIAWIPGRNDTLLAIFILASFIYLLDYIETRTIKKLIGHLSFFVLALFTKENAVMIIPLVFLYLQFIKKENVFSHTKIILSAIYILCIIPWFFLRKHALEGSSFDLTISLISKSIIENFPFLLQYIGKIFLPINLSVLSTLQDTNYIFPILAFIILTVGLYLSKGIRWPYFLFGIVWFLFFVLPSLSVTADKFGGLEHRMYLPLIGILLAGAELKWLKDLSHQKQNNNTILVMGLCILTFALITTTRLAIFKNKFNFYESALKTSKHSIVACINLGSAYKDVGKYDKALEVYRKGLSIDSTVVMLHNNIGCVYLDTKNYAEAEKEFFIEIRLHPENSRPYHQLGLVYSRTGRKEKAVEWWKKTLTIEKDFLQAYQNLCKYYSDIKDTANFNYYQKELRKRGY